MSKKIKNFLITNTNEIIYITFLIFIFLILSITISRHLGNIIIDCGREAYFPQQILKGKLLYKDLFNIFGPLSYQINAIFYKIFSINLSTLRLAGTINAGFILILLYSITRFFTTKEISFAISILIMVSCVFNPWIFNYIFPYSYAMVYAFSTFLFSVLFLLLYLKSSKQFFIPLSWFFLGISMTCKYEYVLYLIFLMFLTFILKINKKYILYSLILFLITPVLSFSVLFLQGLTINDLLEQFRIIKQFALSPSLNYFYSYAGGLYPNKFNMLTNWKFFYNFCILFLLLFSSLYFWVNLSKKSPHYLYKKILSYIFIAVFTYQFFNRLNEYINLLFCWLPLFTLLLLIPLFFKSKKSFSKEFFTTKNGTYILLIMIAMLASAKSFFYLNLKAYATFAFPLLFIVNSIFIIEFLPLYFKIINKKSLKKAFFIIILIMTILFAGYLKQSLGDDVLIQTSKGSIYNHKNLAESFQASINYIDKEMKKEDSFLVLPEGIMLNFLTNHPSKSIYYATNTPYLEPFGEEKIIDDIKKNPPEYIFINNRNSEDYGKKYICKDYGFDLCNYVKSNYSKIEEFGTHFKMELYKKTSKIICN